MSTTRSAARAAEGSTVFRTIARIGYVVLGILHIVIGVIAISFVVGGGGGEADQGGAMEQIQDAPMGVLLLWVIVLGLVALAIWQIADAFLERNPDTKKKWGYRLKYLGTAVAYLGIAFTALVYALGGQSDSSESSQSFSAQLMSSPGGIVLLVLFGLLIAGIGIAFIVRGFTRAFKKHLDLPPDPLGKGIVTFGVVGYVAKGIAIAVTGALFVVAAVTHNAENAGGLDAALHALAELPFGPIILWVVGAGLIIYGLFCFARARYARM
jgi:membrane protease YdiL (CAAX protease family)